MDTISKNQFACALTAEIAVRKINARAFERDLRTETARWTWSVAVWEMTRAEEPEAAVEALEFDPDEVVVVVQTDLVS